jgi:hypothetical protein
VSILDQAAEDGALEAPYGLGEDKALEDPSEGDGEVADDSAPRVLPGVLRLGEEPMPALLGFETAGRYL